MSSITSSLTAGACLSALKSLRLITAVALAPMASFCSIGWGPLKNDVIVSVTGLVMPLIVRSPSMLTGWPSSNTTLFDVNVAVGNCAVSKKSSLWICWSNSSKPVSMEVISMVTSTSAVSASLSSTTVPEVWLKRRICLDNPMWLYEKRGNVWLWSMTYVAGAANAGPATTEANNAAIRVFFMVFPVKSSKNKRPNGCYGCATMWKL